MRDEAGGETDFMTDLMEVIAELSNERLLATGPRQQEPIVGEWFQGAKEPQPLDKLAYEGIYWDESFGFHFSERDMNGPLTRAGGTKAV